MKWKIYHKDSIVYLIFAYLNFCILSTMFCQGGISIQKYIFANEEKNINNMDTSPLSLGGSVPVSNSLSFEACELDANDEEDINNMVCGLNCPSYFCLSQFFF